MSAQQAVTDVVEAEDQARADMYALLGTLLLQAPSPGLLGALATAEALPAAREGQALAQAWMQLTDSARHADATAVAAEFDALFVSVGTPLINPNASKYLAGFLMEKPLAALRDDLHALGLGRAAGSRELEDHLGALCEIMRLLIAGTAGMPARALAQQRTFFIKHISPWYRRCLDDIRQVEDVPFYRRVADFAQAFFDIEFEAFGIDDGPTGHHEAVIASTEDHHA